MRAAIYNPYLDTLGGGERYTLTVAKVLSDKDYKVDLEWASGSIKGKIERRFNLDLSGINVVKDVNKGDGYDVCFWVSDGSIPLLRARNNILHFQFPFNNVGGGGLLNKMKLMRINSVVCNSKFTKGFIDKEYGVKSVVVYPPVDTINFKPGKKENIIISIGRFSQLTQAKRQDVLVDVFKKMYDGGLKDWKLVLAGGVEVGVGDYVDQLRKSAEGYPITIFTSPSFNKLKEIYSKAKIFWSASGFGINEMNEPTKVEHFGITIVEAMAAGCVPIIYSAGGHKEIVKDGTNGLLWTKKNELIEKTDKLLTDRKLIGTITKDIKNNSNEYSYGKFKTNIEKII